MWHFTTAFVGVSSGLPQHRTVFGVFRPWYWSVVELLRAIDRIAPIARVRDGLAWAWIVVATVVLTFPVVLTAFLFGTGWPSVQLWARAVSPAMGARRVHVRNAERLTQPGVVVMANHSSHLDPPILLGLAPTQLHFLAKAPLFRIPFFGQALWASGQIPIDRKDRNQAFASIDRVGEVIRGGKSVIVFPEGTRACREQMGPFKSGGFVIALRCAVPIVPVGIAGTRHIWEPGSARFEPGDIAVVVGEAVDAGAFDDKEALMDEVRTRIDALRVEARAILDGASGPSVRS